MTRSLLKLLASRSAVQRLEAQREILKRGRKPVFANGIFAIAKDGKPSLDAHGARSSPSSNSTANPQRSSWRRSPRMRRCASSVLRAMTDRLTELEGVPVEPYLAALEGPEPARPPAGRSSVLSG